MSEKQEDWADSAGLLPSGKWKVVGSTSEVEEFKNGFLSLNGKHRYVVTSSGGFLTPYLRNIVLIVDIDNKAKAG